MPSLPSKTAVLSFFVRHGITVGITIFAMLQVYQWYHPAIGSLYKPPERPYVAPVAPVTKAVERVVIPAKIEALKPTPKQIAKIEKAIGGKLPTGPLLSVNEIKELCHGGNLVLTLEPVDVTAPSGPSKVVATIFPSKPKFFEFTLRRTATVSYGKAFGGKNYGSVIGGSFLHLDLRQDLFRTGPAEWFVGTGVFVGGGIEMGYVEAGTKITF